MAQFFRTNNGDRTRVLRGILLAIIIGTFPFYCLGFWLWGTAQSNSSNGQNPPQETLSVGSTNTPIGGDLTATTTLLPTRTTFPTFTPINPNLQPTPYQFQPPPATAFLSATPFPTFFIPPPTNAPTFTPIPSFTPITLPSNTPLPFPSNTPLPLPSNTPIPQPSNTPVPIPSNTSLPPPSILPPPSDTPPPLPPDPADPNPGG